VTAVGRAAVDAPTKQLLPAAEHDQAEPKQPPAAAKQTPYGDDVEEAAELLIARVRRDLAGLDPLDRFDSTGWWTLVHRRTAELLHDVVRGEPLAELAEQNTYRQIEQQLREQGTPVSDSTITKLIKAWRAWKPTSSRQ
jgi:hypothetical protein